MRDKLNSQRCSKFLRALADPERLKIIQCLGPGPMTVGQISAQLNSPLANVSHHLKQLRIAGVVVGRKQGRQVHYEVAQRVAAVTGDARQGKSLNVLDFGCCRLELGQK